MKTELPPPPPRPYNKRIKRSWKQLLPGEHEECSKKEAASLNAYGRCRGWIMRQQQVAEIPHQINVWRVK